MNESMNFGNIGIGGASSTSEPVSTENQTSETVTENVADTQASPQKTKPDLMAGVSEAENSNDEEAIKDFQKAETKKTNFERDADNFSQIDFGPLKKYLDDDDITDISYSNNGQLWLKSLSRGVYRADQQDVNNELIEKIAFQCSNIMGKTFNMAHPFLDSESAELRMNFVHDSIARNGIAVVFRKTPAKIRLEKQKLLNEKYVRLSIHDFLINCVKGHCNIIVCGETGSGKTELIKYLAAHTAENEKIITIEDTLELHLDRIFPQRDIVAMKTNNIASYSDVLVTCMRQNPIWILLSEVRSAEAVTAVRNSISSGHYILSTIHADKAESIPHRMYSLLESNIDVEQFLKTIYRYVQIGVFVRGRYKPEEKRFVREIAGVCEFFVTDDTNEPKFNNIYLKTVGGEETYNEPTKYIKNYLEGQGVDITNLFGEKMSSLEEANRANGINNTVNHSSISTNESINVETKIEEPKIAENVQKEIPKKVPKLKLADISSNAKPVKKEMETLEESIPTKNVIDEKQEMVGSMESQSTPVLEELGDSETIDDNSIMDSPLPNGAQLQEVAEVATQPVVPVQPVAEVTAQPVVPVQPVAEVATQPVVPVQPVAEVATQPVVPVQPVAEVATQPVVPVQPVAEVAAQPVVPVQPVAEVAAQPVVPVQPVAEVTAQPVVPVQPVAEVAAQPVVPVQPVAEVAAQPVVPVQPVAEVATQPVVPVQPVAEVAAQPVVPVQPVVDTAPKKTGLEILMPPTQMNGNDIYNNNVNIPQQGQFFGGNIDNNMVQEPVQYDQIFEPASVDGNSFTMPKEHLIPLPSLNNNSQSANTNKSIDSQLMAATKLEEVQEIKPELINKPVVPKTKKPFTKQKFFSGVLK